MIGHPYIVGLVDSFVKKSGHLKTRKKFTAAFKRKRLPFVYLLLKIAPADLKNMLKCMRLMDIVGINIPKKYERRIIKYLDRLDDSAKTAKRVNVVGSSKNRFIGYYTKDLINGSIAIWTKRLVF